MIFKQLNPGDCRSYLVGCESTKEVVIVDPVIDFVDDYLKLLEADGLTLTMAIDTHTHADHISGASLLMDRTGCEYVMSEHARAKCPTVRIKDGHEYDIGGVKAKVIHTPGHTKDSICLVLSDRILTGDTLFLDAGGAGRDDLPGGDAGAHYDSLEKLKGLSDELVVYPGHDYRNRKPSMLGMQLVRNPHMAFHARQDFIDYLEGLKLGPADWMKEVLKANVSCTRDLKAAFIPSGVSACEVMGTKDDGGAKMATIKTHEVEKKIGDKELLLLLDVREGHELADHLGHIEGIIHIPVDQLSRRISEIKGLKDREVISICRSGGRATQAAKILVKEGFSKVSVMEGGMVEWNKDGNPVKR